MPNRRQTQRRRPRNQRHANGGIVTGGASSSVAAPRVIQANPTLRRTLRWSGLVSAISSVTVTRASLLSAILASPGANAGATTLLTIPVYESVRVRSVRVLVPPNLSTSNGAVTQEVYLEWSSYLGKDERYAVAVTSNEGAAFVCRPPANSRAALWGSSNTSANAATSINEVLFTIGHDPNFASPTSIIPLTVEATLDFVQANDTDAKVTFTMTATTSSLAPGLYQAPLDLMAPAGGVGTLVMNPLTVQDIRLDSGNNPVTVSGVTRVN